MRLSLPEKIELCSTIKIISIFFQSKSSSSNTKTHQKQWKKYFEKILILEDSSQAVISKFKLVCTVFLPSKTVFTLRQHHCSLKIFHKTAKRILFKGSTLESKFFRDYSCL